MGGLTGLNQGSVSQSYSIGNIVGGTWVGGIAGFNDTTGTISNTYAQGNITGSTANGGRGGIGGGLVGVNSGDLDHSWTSTTGNSSTFDTPGGLVGLEDTVATANLRDTFWDFTNAPISGVGQGPLPNLNNKPIHLPGDSLPYQISNYPGLDFTNIWTIQPGTSRAYLRNAAPAFVAH